MHPLPVELTVHQELKATWGVQPAIMLHWGGGEEPGGEGTVCAAKQRPPSAVRSSRQQGNKYLDPLAEELRGTVHD